MFAVYLVLAFVSWGVLFAMLQRKEPREFEAWLTFIALWAAAHLSATWVRHMTGLSYEIPFLIFYGGPLPFVLPGLLRAFRRTDSSAG